MVKLTLQEQLLKAGLVSQGQARTTKSEKHKQAKQQRNSKNAPVDEVKQQVQAKLAEQAAKDRERNLLKKQEEDRKQLVGQIKQIIKQNRLPLPHPLKEINDDSICGYHFTDGNKVKVLYVKRDMHKQITEGQLAIVILTERYAVVPVETALKIKELDSSFIKVLNDADKKEQDHNDDPYAGYEVPDDLIW